MIRRELGVFLIIGVLATLVDFVIYRGLVATGLLSVGVAKASGFMIGPVFAYFSNKLWTFKKTEHAPNSALRFFLLYAVTMGANVLVNSVSLFLLPSLPVMVYVAFVMATGVSAVLNFIGMKFFVFKPATTTVAP